MVEVRLTEAERQLLLHLVIRAEAEFRIEILANPGNSALYWQPHETACDLITKLTGGELHGD